MKCGSNSEVTHLEGFIDASLCAGGSSGIGLGLAEEFLTAGSTVIVTGRRESALNDAKQKLPGLHIHVSDVSSVQDRQSTAKWAVENFPKLNILVSKHGHLQRQLTHSKSALAYSAIMPMIGFGWIQGSGTAIPKPNTCIETDVHA